MNKLTKQRLAEKAGLQKKLADAKQEVEEKKEAADALIAQANDLMDVAVGDYNEVIAEVNAFRESVHSDMESYFDEKSEKWQEGEAGEAYSTWKEAWGEEVEDATYEQPSSIDLEFPDDEALGEEKFPDEPG